MAESKPEGIETLEVEKNLKGKKLSWAKLRHIDSLHLEAGRISGTHDHRSKSDWRTTLILAFQSIGIVYGDIGTSPLYVYASTFTDGIKNNDDILGVLSLIIYTIVLLPLTKYVLIVLWANDNGDGGTFALYSLICRYAKVSLIPKDQPEDRQLSNYRLDTPSSQLKRAQKIKEKLETSTYAKTVLFLVTILGTSMVIGDGVLTPCISVLSAVSGIQSVGTGNTLNQDAVVGLSIAILVVLFSVQRFGTDKVGYSFAPIVFTWFCFISGIGLYNLITYDVGVLRAFNPKYIVDYFKRNGSHGWISLGGVVLAITGNEAMFADLGHFNVRAIQISFSGIVFPAILLAYIGQAAYLRKFPEDVADTFYKSCPHPIYWPMFVVAVGAAIIASQAMISGAFSIVTQSLSLSCFPRVKVVHTSTKYEGQVYIPEINYVLMIACVIVSAGFRTTDKIGNAYGIAVVTVMLITTFMVTLIMLVVWKISIWLIALFFAVYVVVEGVYLSSVLYKFKQGGYLPLAFALVLMIIMGIWHYVHRQIYVYELNNKVSSEYIRDLVSDPKVNRVPGMGLIYSELVQGIPPIFPHFLANIPSLHSVVVFISIKSFPVGKVALDERFLFRYVEPKEYRMFRCVVRYGYNDIIEESAEFEAQLVDHLNEFIRLEQYFLEAGNPGAVSEPLTNPQHSTMLVNNEGRAKGSTVHIEESLQQAAASTLSFSSSSTKSFNAVNSVNSSNRISGPPLQGAEAEMQYVQRAKENGVVYLLGGTEVTAKQNSSFIKRMVVNYLYDFLRKNFRGNEKMLEIPNSRLVKVGMTYEI